MGREFGYPQIKASGRSGNLTIGKIRMRGNPVLNAGSLNLIQIGGIGQEQSYLARDEIIRCLLALNLGADLPGVEQIIVEGKRLYAGW
ncbi:hypothetical protein D3C75_1039720 [compost metagenome]